MYYHGTSIEQGKKILKEGFSLKTTKRTQDLNGIYLSNREFAGAYSIQTSCPIWVEKEFWNLIPKNELRDGIIISVELLPGAKIVNSKNIPKRVFHEGRANVENYIKENNIDALIRGEEIIVFSPDIIKIKSYEEFNYDPEEA